MGKPRSGSGSLQPAVLWIARISGSLIVVLFVFVAVSGLLSPGQSLPTPREWLQLSMFPIGLCVGYVVAWRWQFLGGVISLGCLVLFFVVMWASGNPVHGVPAFYPFAVPGLFFIWYWLLSRRAARGHRCTRTGSDTRCSGLL